MSPQPPTSHWSMIATALPLTALSIAIVALRTSPTSDFTTRLGGLFKATILCGAIAIIGEAAAILALYRNERPTWLSLLAALLNAVIILPAIYLASKMDWD
ncbi:MAG: hypothetical protein NTW74_10000 [Acidobacteria bacterium]|nr:hypothetical protein [Acidobacteriota bacterium]